MRYPLEEMRQKAVALRTLLELSCDRICIAGSIRRDKSTVKDIELVAIPKLEPVKDLFGTVIRRHSLLDRRLVEIGLEPRRKEDGSLQGLGEKAKFYVTPEGIPIDLFICNPETWGVIFVLRTGSAEFNLRLVAHVNKIGYKMRDGRLYDDRGRILSTREEEDVFRVLKVKWKEPHERT